MLRRGRASHFDEDIGDDIDRFIQASPLPVIARRYATHAGSMLGERAVLLKK